MSAEMSECAGRQVSELAMGGDDEEAQEIIDGLFDEERRALRCRRSAECAVAVVRGAFFAGCVESSEPIVVDETNFCYFTDPAAEL
jgi:hypothetical protein